MTEASPTSPPPPPSSTSQTTRASSTDEDNTTTEVVGAAAATTTTVPMMMTNTTAAPAGGGQGGRVPVGSGRKDPNNTTSSSRHNDDHHHHNGDSTGHITAKNTTATNLFTTTTAMTNLIVSTASSSAEAATTSTTAAVAAAEPPLQPSTEDPQEEECVLCCYLLPLKSDQSVYKDCCGELICDGCIIAQKRTLIIGSNVTKPIAGSKEEDLEFITILSSKQIMACPFCRGATTNHKELVKNLWRQIDDYNDPRAMNMLGSYYRTGKHGLSKNRKKAMELFQQAYDLGNLPAAYNLSLHVPGEARRMKYLEEGVKRGDVTCMHRLAYIAYESGNYKEGTRLYMTAARSGDETAMETVMRCCYRNRDVSKDDLATTLRAHQAANDKRKTEAREYAIRHKAFEKGFREKVRIDDEYTILQYVNSRRHTSQNITEIDLWSLVRALAKKSQEET